MRKQLTTIALAAALAACNDPAPKTAAGLSGPIPVSQTTRLPGLDGPVEVLRDPYGVPHVYAQTDADAVRVQGYLTAADRYWQMEGFRLVAKGEISSLFGPIKPVLDLDLQYRAIFMTRDGRPQGEVLYEVLPAEIKDLADAYAAGINAWIADARAGRNGQSGPHSWSGDRLLGVLFPDLLDRVPQWTGPDLLAIGRFQQWNLSGTLEMEETAADLQAALTTTQFTQLIQFKPAATSVAIPTRAPALPLLDDLGIDTWGSNNWVVAPDGTSDGLPLVANDPHLAYLNPPIFHMIGMDTQTFGNGEFNLYGVSFAGIPGILIGHSEHVAWGVTVLGYDVTDLYEETLNPQRDAVWFQDEWVKLRRVPVHLRMPDGGTLEKTMWIVPHHGPILPKTLDDGEQPRSIRWTGQEATQDFRTFYGLAKAADMDEFFEAVGHFGVGAQNFLGADTAGEIGYYGHALLPARDWDLHDYPPFLPLPGTGPAEWNGFVDSDRLPRVRNPARGYVQTANHDIVGNNTDGDPLNDELYTWGWRDLGFRTNRIETELVDGFGSHSTDTMAAIQADNLSLEGLRMEQFIIQAIDDNPALARDLGVDEAREYLDDWQGTTPTGIRDGDNDAPAAEQRESIAATIYYTWSDLVQNETLFQDELDAAGDDLELFSLRERTLAMVRIFEQSDDPAFAVWFDDVETAKVETRDQMTLAALAEAFDIIADRLGTTRLSEWQWGKMHLWNAPDFLGIVGLTEEELGPVGQPGANHTVDVADAILTDRGFESRQGPATRYIAQVGPDRVRSWWALPGGIVFDPDSPWYDNLLQDYLDNRYFPALLTWDEVHAAHTERFVFRP